MNPITREEQYLNRLTGEEGIIPDKPVTREEQYFARLCGGDNVIPDKPVTRREQYLATLCGEDVITPTKPVTRIEQYMAFASGESESKPEKPITREEMYWDKYQGGDVPEEKTIAFTDIITVTDALARPAVDLQSEITATQNLNGYEYPWVGGAGKNLLSMTIDGIKALNTVGTWSGNAYTYKGITYTLQADDGNNITGILVNGTSTGWGILIIGETNLISDTSYVFNTTNPTPPNMYITLATASWEKSGEKVLTESTMQIEFTATATETRLSYIGLDGSANNVLVQPMIMLSTESDATFTPYSNICPISGRTEVNVTRTGKNWYFSKTVDYTSLGVNLKTDGKGKFEVSGTSTGGWINPFSLRTNITLPVGTYTISASINGTMPEDETVVGVERVSGTSINGYLRLSSTNPSVSLTFTVTEETVVTQGMYAPAGEFDAEITIQIELGSTATAYEPYEGDTFNTELGRTVYGGTLDLTTGELTITHAYVDLGDLTWYANSLNLFSHDMNEKKAFTKNYITTSYRTVDKYSTELANGETTSITTMTHGHTYTYVYIKDERATTAEEFTTLVTGQKMVYELATPQTISLTPTEVQMLENNNTIWADSGRVQLTYLSRAAKRVQLMNASLKANTLKLTKGAIKE